MRTFKISFTVQVETLPTVVALLASEVRSFQVDEIEDSEPAPAARRVRNFPNTPLESRRINKLIIGLLANGPKTLDEVGAFVSQHGFARTSASPSLSQMAAHGIVKRVTTGVYALP
jgi:hypothetical protein